MKPRFSNRAIIATGLLVCIVGAVVVAYFLGMLGRTGLLLCIVGAVVVAYLLGMLGRVGLLS